MELRANFILPEYLNLVNEPKHAPSWTNISENKLASSIAFNSFAANGKISSPSLYSSSANDKDQNSAPKRREDIKTMNVTYYTYSMGNFVIIFIH